LKIKTTNMKMQKLYRGSAPPPPPDPGGQSIEENPKPIKDDNPTPDDKPEEDEQ
jgi:hypothetical protein